MLGLDRLFLGFPLVLGLGCAISQNVTPIDRSGIEKVCIIEAPAVRETFLPEYRKALTELGIESEVIAAGSPASLCKITSTYFAKWSWDLTIYMSYCEIKVFRDGVPAGSAIYDSTKGSGNLGKFIDAEPKIRELVQRLYAGAPARATP